MPIQANSHTYNSKSLLLLYKMKGEASRLFKQVAALLMAVVKAKSMVAKSKVGVVKARVALLGLFRGKKAMMGSISHKIQALVNRNNNELCKAIVLYNGTAADGGPLPPPPPSHQLMLTYHEDDRDVTDEEEEYDDDDDRYPDLRHSLFDEEEDGVGDCIGSAIDLVRNARGQEEGEFVLEDEIDLVADVFIRRFHNKMRLQKLLSFKRQKECVKGSV